MNGYDMLLKGYEYFEPVYEEDENRKWVAERVRRRKEGAPEQEEVQCGFFVVLNFGSFVQFCKWKEGQKENK